MERVDVAADEVGELARVQEREDGLQGEEREVQPPGVRCALG